VALGTVAGALVAALAAFKANNPADAEVFPIVAVFPSGFPFGFSIEI
jgi:hypothetical protein